MKILLLSLIVVVSSAFIYNEFSGNGPQIEFVKTSYDYGTIKYGADGTCSFEFKNTGNAPLIIQDAKSSSSSIVAEWSTSEIAPGATATITVTYDTTRTGAINKDVTVISNAVNTPTVTLRIRGNVLPKPATAPPTN